MTIAEVSGSYRRAKRKRSSTFKVTWRSVWTLSSSSSRSYGREKIDANAAHMSSAVFTSWPSSDRIVRSPSRAWRSRSTTRILSDIPLVEATSMPTGPVTAAGDKWRKPRPDGETGKSRYAEREESTSYELLGLAREVVGQRSSLAGEVGRALVVLLIERAARLIEEILRGPQGLLLGRLQRTPFQIAERPRDVGDVLPGAVEKSLLLRGRHLRAQRLGRRRRGRFGRRLRHGRR